MTIYSKCTRPYVSPSGLAYGCGQCENCKKQKALEWSIRGTHELNTSPTASLIHLTYAPKHLPINAETVPMNKYDACGTLEKKDMVLFIKRLRKKWKNRNIRFIYCGEYGPHTWRPHYHCILYGLSPGDCIACDVEKIWRLGHVEISEDLISTDAIQYVIGYIRKKLSHNEAIDKYSKNHRELPYMRSSKGLGKEWAIKNVERWEKCCTVAFNGNHYPIPRYYIKTIKKMEGRIVKYNSEIKRKSFIIESRKNYLVIENPKGKHTSIINKTLKKIRANNMIEWEKRFNVNKESIKQIRKKYSMIYAEQDHTKELLNNLYTNMTNEEIAQERYHFTDETIIKNSASVENKTIEDKTTLTELKGIATRKERDRKNSPYGKREKIDLAFLLDKNTNL